ncbi:MAG: hypothetical protein HYY31_06405, partial [Chloroflexi bacterium]|nr:hypothetical protein [Chloroflexota bacterium]
ALDVMLQEGADPSRIQMGHLRHTRGNLDWLLEIARKGCFMALDTIGRDRAVFNPIRLAIIGALVALGYGNRILLSMDHTSAWVPQRPPRYAFMGTAFTDIYSFLPSMRQAGISERQIERIFVDNPRELLPF